MFRKKKRTLMKGQLHDVDVELVSLLFDDMKPANQKGAVIKSKDGKEHAFVRSTAKFKSDDQGRLYVTVMEPDTVDAQGDTCTKEEIQKACDRFSRKGMVGKNDINHNFHTINDCFVAENSILKAKDPEHYPDTKVGSWVQTIKFDNLGSEYWQKVKKGDFNGVSLYGFADVDSGKSMNMLTENMASLFIDEVVTSKPGDTFSDISVVLLNKDEKIDAGIIEDIVLTNSLDGTPAGQTVGENDVSCPTSILLAEFSLAQTTVEFYTEKYGAEAFGAYVNQHLVKKTEKALRLLLFKGDRSSGTDKLKALDGVIQQAVDATPTAVTDINPETYDTWTERFEQTLL